MLVSKLIHVSKKIPGQFFVSVLLGADLNIFDRVVAQIDTVTFATKQNSTRTYFAQIDNDMSKA